MLIHLCELAGAARLNGVDLSLSPRQSLEACGQLGAVKEEALGCLDRAERGAGRAADAAGVVPGLVERAVLLCLLAVGCKRLGERVGGGGWVSLGSVVDVYVAVSSC